MNWFYGYARTDSSKPWTWVCRSVSWWDVQVLLILRVRHAGVQFMICDGPGDWEV